MSEEYVVLGAGIAGLAAAYELQRRGYQVTLVEQKAEVGGLARTFNFDGFRFDLGAHRFHTGDPALVTWLQQLLQDDLLVVPRKSRVYVDEQFVDYPLRLRETLSAFSLTETTQMVASYTWAQIRRAEHGDYSFEDWIVNRFGAEMYKRFFRPYAEKVWGVPGHQLSADWAAERIGIPSFAEAMIHATGSTDTSKPATIIRFYYPRYGFGMVTEALVAGVAAAGGRICLNYKAVDVEPHDDGFVVTLQNHQTGSTERVEAGHVISTIPIDALLQLMPVAERVRSQFQLDFRGLLLVFLALDRERVTSDTWTYFPGPEVLFSRTYEPKNWSANMVPGEDVTSLGLEIFATPSEPVWDWPDAKLVGEIIQQLEELDWIRPQDVLHSHVVRVPNGYPLFRTGYRARLAAVHRALSQWPRLHLLGRTGAFRYMNSDGIVQEVFRFVLGLEQETGPDEEAA